MLNTYQIFISLHKERQNDLIRFLNFIASQINTEKLIKKSLNKNHLEYLLSKVSYKMYCKFESQHRHRYSIKNILKEFDITLMEHEKIKPSESLQNEFEKYKNFVTNPYNLNLNPKHLQRINTYNTLTYNSLKKYLQYLVLEMKLNEKDITSFKGHILKFPEYCKWLAENVKTESFFVKSRWVSGYLSFLIREYKLDKSYIKSYEKIKKKYKLIKQRLKIVDGQYLQKRKDKLKDIDIHRITQKIKKLEKTYFITKNHLILKALITIKILFHLCWRSRNVRELKLGKTLIYEKGN